MLLSELSLSLPGSILNSLRRVNSLLFLVRFQEFQSVSLLLDVFCPFRFPLQKTKWTRLCSRKIQARGLNNSIIVCEIETTLYSVMAETVHCYMCNHFRCTKNSCLVKHLFEFHSYEPNFTFACQVDPRSFSLGSKYASFLQHVWADK